MGKKKFIDKKTSTTFQLMARDSTDPAFAQSDRVFVRVDNNPRPADSVFADSPDDPDAEFDTDDGFAEGNGPLPDDVRKEILELGFPDDGYNYLFHLREIKNTGGGANFFSNPKFKLEHVSDVKAYDASRVRIKEAAEKELEENTLYTVASHTAKVRVQKAVDPEVAALLDDSDDVSRFGSDVEDLEEDFVVQANLCEGGDDEEKAHASNGKNFSEESLISRSLTSKHVLQAPAYTTLAGDCGPLYGSSNGATDVHCVVEKPRGRRLLDEQFDLAHASNGKNFSEESLISRSLTSKHVLQAPAYTTLAGDCGPLYGSSNGATDVHCVVEKPRGRRLLDEQFDLLERQEYGTDDDNSDYDDYYGDYEENYRAEDESLAEKLKLSLSNHVVDNQELDGGGKYKVPAEGEEEEESAADVIRRTKEYGEQYEVEDDGKDAVIFEESSDESEVWDCETIVSTYTNLDNHPGKIETPGATRKKKLAETVTAAFSSSSPIISLRGKAKLPLDFLPGGRKPAAEKVKDSTIEKIEPYKRKQHGLESKEEKKERKTAVKEERREARRTKKEMKELYKCEANRAQRAAAVSGPSSIHLL